ncbi:MULTISPECIES: AAA family ATPase [unclassified Streptomyces]|uniref:AAA family ATPase n=1 Tax=unclassified Streptomyces TaxID=2593676 RepID=UPI0035DFE30D
MRSTYATRSPRRGQRRQRRKQAGLQDLSSEVPGDKVVLVERDPESRTLRLALANCVAGTAGIVLIEGAAGCGKSELIDTVAEWADDAGALVLRGFGSSEERELPLGLVRQLAGDAPDGALPEVTVAPEGRPRVGAMREFQTALHQLSATTPVVIAVDDLHHADVASLCYLQHIVRHLRSARLLLVLAAPLRDDRQDAAFETELLRRSNVQRVLLRRLSPAGTADVLADTSWPGRREGLANELHTISGGNPLLLRALLEEHRSADPADLDEGTVPPAPGGLFSQAVLTCLRLSGPHAASLGAALAVLGDAYTPERAGRLIDAPAFTVARAVASLAASGILRGHRFRHPAAEATVLDHTPPHVLAALHLRSAELLHGGGGRTIPTVARHLIAAARHGGSLDGADWAVDVLRAAAEHLLMDEEAAHATAALELAHELSREERQRAEIKTRLAAITWRVDPGTAERHLSAPLEALRSGLLPAECLTPVTTLLVGQGRIAEAAELRSRVVHATAGYGAEAPRPANGAPGTDVLDRSPSGAPAIPSQRGEERPPRAHTWDLPETESRVETAVADRFLETTVLSEATLDPIVQAVRVLTHSRQPKLAAHRCRQLIEAAERHGAPAWQALFTALRADVLLRLGDLQAAEGHALSALAHLPERGNSAFAGGPTATLIRARTLMGKHASVARQLQQPVADTLLRSVHGLFYLRARGLYHAANHQHHAALGDFLEAGRLAQHWGMDRPTLLPWRSDAAEALIRLGDTRQAEQLIRQQLAMPDARRPWVRGISLRLRALISDPRQQPALLGEAADELGRSGDLLELARTMADLGRVLRVLGENVRASAVTRRALNLARDCGAEPLCAEIVPELGPEDRTAHRPHPLSLHTERVDRPERVDRSERPDADTKLSDSERRVATLAASGYTNREISLRLHITVSTVEQHLTRVYRKLNITRRQDLPVDLQLTASAMDVA